MRRALVLIIVLTVVSFGGGIWLDILQRSTAQGYLEKLEVVRAALLEGRMDAARAEEAYLHACWQHDARWLNCLISHHHTRSVNTALLHLATALEQGWVHGALYAVDEVADALGDICTSDFVTWENVL